MIYFGKFLIVAVCLLFSTLAIAQESSLLGARVKADDLNLDRGYSDAAMVKKSASRGLEGNFDLDYFNVGRSHNALDLMYKVQGSYADKMITTSSITSDQDDRHVRKWRYKISSNTSLSLLPATALYPSYIADPRHPRFAVKMMSMTRRGIAETTKSRISTSLGCSLGLFRIHSDHRPDVGFQFQVGAGYFSQWDAKRGQDGIGGDGVYHFLGTWTADERLAFKLGTNHMSSHISDEYIENTGRKRFGYTREEIVAGASYLLAMNWRTYVEAGYAYLARKAPQKRLRFQGGIEYESDRILFNGFAGWFVALDTKSYEENGWNFSTAMQVGIVIPKNPSRQTHRFGLEFYHGRSPMGEFFQEEESHVALGWWLEF